MMNFVTINSYFARYSRIVLTVLTLIFLYYGIRSVADFWDAIHGVPPVAADVQTRLSQSKEPRSNLPDAQAIAALEWFGHLPEEQTMPADAAADILSQFELKGISKSSNSILAGAYIAQKGNPEAYYHIGDALPGSICSLAQVFSDHVTLRHGQALLVLKFSDADSASVNGSSNGTLQHNESSVIPPVATMQNENKAPARPSPPAIYAQPLPIMAAGSHPYVTRAPVPLPPRQQPLPFPTQ